MTRALHCTAIAQKLTSCTGFDRFSHLTQGARLMHRCLHGR
ncbi:hypothetical protein ULF88_10875 [Halopseudomonas pachastrellae]|nr:hypothetical protein [Halopseudomonas pachastrellae]